MVMKFTCSRSLSANRPSANGRSQNAGRTDPRWRRDGKELFYVAADGKLISLPVKSAAAGVFEVAPVLGNRNAALRARSPRGRGTGACPDRPALRCAEAA